MNRPLSAICGCEVAANEMSRRCAAPSVSVLITLYNYSAFIENCLDSVRKSNVDGLPGGFEVVVVDDGSTDSSAAVVEKYMATHSLPICLIKKEKNAGVADARNIGLHFARAPLVFILDADNEIRPECLAAHYDALQASDCAMAYGIINRFDHETKKSLGTMSHCEWSERELVLHPCIDAMAMIRKEIALQVGGYSTEYGPTLPYGWEDYDLWLKLAQAGRAGKFIPRILSDYRVHPHSMLSRAFASRNELAAYFCRKFHALIGQHDDLPLLFGVRRCDLAILNGESAQLQFPPKSSPKWIHHFLGKKMRRSICKRLAAVYAWLYP